MFGQLLVNQSSSLPLTLPIASSHNAMQTQSTSWESETLRGRLRIQILSAYYVVFTCIPMYFTFTNDWRNVPGKNIGFKNC